MLKRSETIAELVKALSAAQKAMGNAPKSSTNPHFRSRYADLASVTEAIRPALAEHGLAYVQSIGRESSSNGPLVSVTTLLLHSSGEYLESEVNCIARDEGPQALGSCATYLRRYALMAMAGIAPEDDDDGNAANFGSNRANEPARTSPAPSRTPAPAPVETPNFASVEEYISGSYSKEKSTVMLEVIREVREAGMGDKIPAYTNGHGSYANQRDFALALAGLRDAIREASASTQETNSLASANDEKQLTVNEDSDSNKPQE